MAGLFGKLLASLTRVRESLTKPSFDELVTLYTPVTGIHTDAAFNASEEFALLLGEKIPCPHWITAARWDGQTEIMTLWCGPYGPYDFPGIDIEAARVFAKADSKGGWYWGVYKGRAREGKFPTGKKGRPPVSGSFGKAGVPTPLFKTVIRKK